MRSQLHSPAHGVLITTVHHTNKNQMPDFHSCLGHLIPSINMRASPNHFLSCSLSVSIRLWGYIVLSIFHFGPLCISCFKYQSNKFWEVQCESHHSIEICQNFPSFSFIFSLFHLFRPVIQSLDRVCMYHVSSINGHTRNCSKLLWLKLRKLKQ